MAKRKHDTHDETPAEKPAPAFDLIQFTNTLFGFWRECGARACRRNRRCSGDAQACFHRFWPFASETMKFEYRIFLKALDAGRSEQEALDEAAAAAQTPHGMASIAQAEGAQRAMIVARSPAPLLLSPLPLAGEGRREGLSHVPSPRLRREGAERMRGR